MKFGEVMTFVWAAIIGALVAFTLYASGNSWHVSLAGAGICAAIYAVWRALRGHR